MRLLIVGGTRAARLEAADAREREHAGGTRIALDAAALPFTRVDRLALPSSPRLVRIDDLDLAFPDCQSGGVRLVLTQSTYLLQKLIDQLAPEDVLIATAEQNGGWRVFECAALEDTE